MKYSSILFLVFVNFSASLYAQQVDFETTDFKTADSVAALYPGHSLRNLKILADKLTIPLSTEEEKFRAIYRWVCFNIEYDYQNYLTNKHKRDKLKNNTGELAQWNKKFSLVVFNKLLTEQKTVCTGYAYLIKELSYHAGLSCVIIDGYGRTTQANIGGAGIANHSWNAIQLNNKWYLCDATWSSGAIDTHTGRFVKKFDDSYFLVDPSLFIRNHYPLDSTWLLCDKLTLPEFLNAPLVYNGLFKYKIKAVWPETFDLTIIKGETVSFRFKKNSQVETENILLLIRSSGNVNEVSPLMNDVVDGLYTIDYCFSQRGTYRVYVLLDLNYVCSYLIKVT